ncbi:MAG: hypothetical protein FWH21_00605 [Kiritimatiellaeota bacterium]|nr:hypothetical protein [Kiritimatiellota bacterium]
MKITKQMAQEWIVNPENRHRILIYTPEQIPHDPPPKEGHLVLPTDEDGNFIAGIRPQSVKRVVTNTSDGSAVVYLTAPINPENGTTDGGHLSNMIWDNYMDSCVKVEWVAYAETFGRVVARNHAPAWFVGCVPYPKDMPHSLHQAIADRIAGYDGCFLAGVHNRYPLDKMRHCVEITHRYGGDIPIQRMFDVMGAAKKAIAEIVPPTCAFAQTAVCIPDGCHSCDHYANKPKPSVF